MDVLAQLPVLQTEIETIGLFSCDVASGYTALGMASNSCSLTSFNIVALTYEAAHHFVSTTLSRSFPIVKSDGDWMADVELEHETVEVTLRYCLFRRCLLSCSINTFPGKLIKEECLLEDKKEINSTTAE